MPACTEGTPVLGMITSSWNVQPWASVTVTLYVPPFTPLMDCAVLPVFQR